MELIIGQGYGFYYENEKGEKTYNHGIVETVQENEHFLMNGKQFKFQGVSNMGEIYSNINALRDLNTDEQGVYLFISLGILKDRYAVYPLADGKMAYVKFDCGSYDYESAQYVDKEFKLRLNEHFQNERKRIEKEELLINVF